jgi:hypothetical protein
MLVSKTYFGGAEGAASTVEAATAKVAAKLIARCIMKRVAWKRWLLEKPKDPNLRYSYRNECDAVRGGTEAGVAVQVLFRSAD